LGRFYWDGTKIVKDSVRSELSVLVKSLLYFVEPQLCEGRLTIVTGVPVPTADVASSGNVYFTPYIGSRIALYVENYGWRNYKFDELTLNISAVAADKNLDIWVYDNAGTLTLAMTEWSNDILRATALAYQDGVLVKSGAPAYRYLGTVRTFNAGVTRDTVTSRFVWNYYNRVDRHLLVNDSTDSWTYTTNTTWRALNTSANNRVTCVIGVDETIVKFSVHVMGSNSNTNPIAVGIGLDVTNNNTAKVLRNMGPTSAAVKYWLGADFCENPGIGYHFLQIVEYSGGNTTTFYGDNNLPGVVAAGGIGSICC
jgi:hypothetical protein